MRFLLYNIAYGTGCPGGEYRRLWQAHRYLATAESHYRRIVRFIAARRPDAVALVEADAGSRRTGGVNQIELLARELDFAAGSANKYAPDAWYARLPYFRHQHNALLGNGLAPDEAAAGVPLLFSCGSKRRIVSARIGAVRCVVVHLALKRAVRARQLEELAALVDGATPTVLAGDFNTFAGAEELARFLAGHGWRSANDCHLPTYPAWNPRRERDYILYSPGLRLTGFQRYGVHFSDHLPLAADFELENPV